MPPSPATRSRAHAATCATLTALVALAIAWELWLAPLRPGGSWLVLKAVPLALLLPAVFRESRKAVQAGALFVWLYAGEGAARAMTDAGLSAQLAFLEVVLAVGYFAAAVVYLRSSARTMAAPGA
ncbi:DUF2069 domain-containing protein [Usitatibacter palustris]|uniref:DUF2069 domain-containing protein n=1 Tax=Usitatibacter palustris TaxID=2732487 RepID=UPI001FEB649E|nr:DUF2069 domain-containing protein [Usitatibacter palustris]